MKLCVKLVIDTHSISAASFEKRFGREAIGPVFSSRLTLGDAHTQFYLLHAFAIFCHRGRSAVAVHPIVKHFVTTLKKHISATPGKS